jgi:four helix bundle protein
MAWTFFYLCVRNCFGVYLLGIHQLQAVDMINQMKIGDRLSNFSISVIHLTKSIKPSYMHDHLVNQLLRSSSSASLNYAEAEGASSDRDYIHKVRISLKEIKESKQCILLLIEAIENPSQTFHLLYKESNELAAILYTCIQKAQSKLHRPVKE